jgi:aminoglycoside phosphotransferase (APT) family kinase protein
VDTPSQWAEPLSDAWDEVAFPDVSDEQIAAIVGVHGLDVDLAAVEQLPVLGAINTALALGDGYVLRVPKAIAQGVADTYAESVAVPAARSAGVRTPALLVFDDSRTILNVPYTIYERVDGENLGPRDLDPTVNGEIYRQLGRQLAVLHYGVSVCPDPNGWLDTPGRMEDPLPLLAQLVSDGILGELNVRWLEHVFDRLRPSVQQAQTFCRFLHNDVQPTNVLIKESAFAALIDWGNAGWGDPGLEFTGIPARAIPSSLAGYREVAPIDGDEAAEARILWDHLCSALRYLRRSPTPGSRLWRRPPAARLIELLAASALIPAWRQLLG